MMMSNYARNEETTTILPKEREETKGGGQWCACRLERTINLRGGGVLGLLVLDAGDAQTAELVCKKHALVLG